MILKWIILTMMVHGKQCVLMVLECWSINVETKKCSKNITFISGDGPHKLNIKIQIIYLFL